LLSFVVSDDFSSLTYQSQTANAKMNQLWSAVTSNTTPYGWYSSLELGGIFLESMSKSFDWVSDNMLENRKKYIHSVGSVGKVKYTALPNQPYTGIFTGCDNVLLRISLAKSPDTSKTSAAGAQDNYTPGFGIKFLRDNVPSANLIAMYSVNGQSSWNYFANDFSNHIPTPTGLALSLLAKKICNCSN